MRMQSFKSFVFQLQLRSTCKLNILPSKCSSVVWNWFWTTSRLWRRVRFLFVMMLFDWLIHSVDVFLSWSLNDSTQSFTRSVFKINSNLELEQNEKPETNPLYSFHSNAMMSISLLISEWSQRAVKKLTSILFGSTYFTRSMLFHDECGVSSINFLFHLFLILGDFLFESAWVQAGYYVQTYLIYTHSGF